MGASYHGGKYTKETTLECVKQVATTLEEGSDMKLQPSFGMN